jgi:hypothetical protein
MPTLPSDQGRRAAHSTRSYVTAFLAIEETESASGATGSPAIRNNVDVTTGDEEITGTSFYESGRSAKVLNLSWIGRGGHQHRIASGFSRAMHVHQQVDSIAHGHRNVIILLHRVIRLR